MEFCPKCGCRLEPKRTGDGNAFVLCCQNAASPSSQMTKKLKHEQAKLFNQHTAKPFMTVISEEDQKIKTMQTIKMKCEKCGNNEVFVWQVQTRGGDEAQLSLCVAQNAVIPLENTPKIACCCIFRKILKQ